jgi:Ca-activated chloride channel family protein
MLRMARFVACFSAFLLICCVSLAQNPAQAADVAAAVILGSGVKAADPKAGDAKPGDVPPPKPLQRERPIQMDVNMVLVNVTVTDTMNRLVTGLEKEHFQVFEEKEEQKIIHFSAEDVPLSMGVVFDASGSMSNKINRARMAAMQFFKTANPADEFCLVDFNDSPRLLSDFTGDVDEMQNKLNFSQPHGRTALLDAIYLSLNQMRHAKNQKKAILILSDGGDNHSRYTETEIKNMVKEADVQIYAIGIFEPFSSRGRTPEELSGPSLLTDVAETTGGRQFPVDNLNELPDVAGKIALELRNQYVIGYSPKNGTRDGRWRKITVKLKPPHGLPPLHVYAKTGYYAPSQ